MISPELVRRYPFFSGLDDAQQRAIAAIAKEVMLERGTKLFEEGQPADTFYLLLSGSVDLSFRVENDLRAEIPIGEINPGEPFAISALIEPHVLMHTARTASRSTVLKMDAEELGALCAMDSRMGYALMFQVAKAAMQRLHFTCIQLAAAWT